MLQGANQYAQMHCGWEGQSRHATNTFIKYYNRVIHIGLFAGATACMRASPTVYINPGSTAQLAEPQPAAMRP